MPEFPAIVVFTTRSLPVSIYVTIYFLAYKCLAFIDTYENYGKVVLK